MTKQGLVLVTEGSRHLIESGQPGFPFGSSIVLRGASLAAFTRFGRNRSMSVISPFSLFYENICRSDKAKEGVIALIGSDPCLLLKAAAVANSAEYGTPGKLIFAAAQCIERLGVERIKECAEEELLPVEKRKEMVLKAAPLWCYSTVVSHLARMAGSRISNEELVGVWSFVGMTHALAYIPLALEHPDLWTLVSDELNKSAEAKAADKALAACDVDMQQAMALISENMGLPSLLTEVYKNREDLSKGDVATRQLKAVLIIARSAVMDSAPHLSFEAAHAPHVLVDALKTVNMSDSAYTLLKQSVQAVSNWVVVSIKSKIGKIAPDIASAVESHVRGPINFTL